MKNKIEKSLYILKTIMIVLVILITITFLPTIIETGLVGGIFLITFFIFAALTIYTYVKQDESIKNNIYYNLIYICLGIYFILIKSRVIFNYRLTTNLYEVDINYFKINFIIIIVVLIGIIVNTLILSLKKIK